MNYLPGEAPVMTSDDRNLVLTTHRIRYDRKGWGDGRVISIMLESLCSCEISYERYPILLAIAAAVLLLTVTAVDSVPAIVVLVGVVLTVVLIAAFASMRRQVICLASSGASIRLNVSSINITYVLDFLDAVEHAKAKRLSSMHLP